MAASSFQHLTLDERRSLFRMHGRNRFRDPEVCQDSRHDISGYYPVTAQDMARARRARLAKLARRNGLWTHVLDRLRAGWSPQQIAGRLRLAGADGEAGGRVCHETIYRHVYGPAGQADGLYRCLPRARRRRGARHGRRPRGHRVPNDRRIEHRPAEGATRSSFGHWEGDLLIFSRAGTGANVTTLVERRSRFLVLLANPDRRPAGIAERIGTALGGLAADLRETVTFDRGFEFMGYPALDRRLGTTSYFCEPRSPWQKGAVENANGRLRRYLPSDVPAEQLSADSLNELACRLNATPRRCLGYRTPAEVFHGRLDPIPAKEDSTVTLSHLG